MLNATIFWSLTLQDKKRNKKSFKGPTEVSFSLHKQCEIQRECVRYTKGLAVKHLGFLTGVMLRELKADRNEFKGILNSE